MCVKKIPFETILEDAKKYNTRGDWSKHSNSKHVIACKNGWLDKCCAHMNSSNKIYSYADKGIIYAFIFNDNTIYIGLTIHPQRRYAEHINNKGKINKKIAEGFTYEYIILEKDVLCDNLSAREIFYMEKFSMDGRYTLLNIRKGGSRGSLNPTISNEQIFLSAQKFITKAEWAKTEPNFHDLAHRRGIMKDASKHMTPLKHFWTLEELMAEAKKYESKKEWRKNSPNSYRTAITRQVTGVCCSHMKPLHRNWSEENILKDITNYTSKYDWYKRGKGSYCAASRRGILNKCCDIIHNQAMSI